MAAATPLGKSMLIVKMTDRMRSYIYTRRQNSGNQRSLMSRDTTRVSETKQILLYTNGQLSDMVNFRNSVVAACKKSGLLLPPFFAVVIILVAGTI